MPEESGPTKKKKERTNNVFPQQIVNNVTIINSIVKYWLSNHFSFFMFCPMFYNNGQTNFLPLSNVKPSKNFTILYSPMSGIVISLSFEILLDGFCDFVELSRNLKQIQPLLRKMKNFDRWVGFSGLFCSVFKTIYVVCILAEICLYCSIIGFPLKNKESTNRRITNINGNWNECRNLNQ